MNERTNEQMNERTNKQTSKQTNKQTNCSHNWINKRITGQAEAIVRSATAADGQDDGFVEDPEFEEFLCADTRSGAVRSGNPGWYFSCSAS